MEALSRRTPIRRFVARVEQDPEGTWYYELRADVLEGFLGSEAGKDWFELVKRNSPAMPRAIISVEGDSLGFKKYADSYDDAMFSLAIECLGYSHFARLPVPVLMGLYNMLLDFHKQLDVIWPR